MNTDKKSEIRVYFFIKFGKQEHLLQIQSGNIYCRHTTYYRSNENSTKPFYDPNEGILAFFPSEISTVTLGDRELSKEDGFIDATLSLEIPYPAFCLHALHADGWDKILTKENIDELHQLLFKSSEELTKFGNYLLVINNYLEFHNRLTAKTRDLGISVRSELVKYIDFTNDHRFIPHEFVGFVKEIAFKEEKEFRYLFKKENLSDPFTFNIGDISDITTVMSFEDFKESFKEYLGNRSTVTPL